MKIIIVGAGFSGLSLAYYLLKAGFNVEIYEKKQKIGGLIDSPIYQDNYYETAANGMIATRQLEKLLTENNIDFVYSGKASKKRWILKHGHPKRLPVNFLLIALRIIYFLILRFFYSDKIKPDPQESVQKYSIRIFGNKITHWLIEPALQGIYAGDPKKLSANLTLAFLFNNSKKNSTQLASKTPKKRGLISGKNGMKDILDGLKTAVLKHGAVIHYDNLNSSQIDKLRTKHHVVLCCGLKSTVEILNNINAEDIKSNVESLKQIELLNMLSVTVFYDKKTKFPDSFGMLVPKSENFNTLGILWNQIIYSRKYDKFSETWILGGAQNPNLISSTDAEIIQIIQKERSLIFKENLTIESAQITRWPESLPHYTIELEKILTQLTEMNQVSLHGNYLGGIGLSKILDKSISLSEDLKNKYFGNNL